MKHLTQLVRDRAWTSVHTAFTEQLQTVKHYFDRRQLEARLAPLIDAASGHEAQGHPPGGPFYLVLYRQSELFVSEYCERWQISPEQVNAELPVLGRLRRLAQPEPRKAGVTKAVLAVLAILGLSFAIGLAGACVHFGYLLGGGR